MGERILRDRLETLHLKDLDKFDRAAIVQMCIRDSSELPLNKKFR